MKHTSKLLKWRLSVITQTKHAGIESKGKSSIEDIEEAMEEQLDLLVSCARADIEHAKVAPIVEIVAEIQANTTGRPVQAVTPAPLSEARDAARLAVSNVAEQAREIVGARSVPAPVDLSEVAMRTMTRVRQVDAAVRGASAAGAGDPMSALQAAMKMPGVSDALADPEMADKMAGIFKDPEAMKGLGEFAKSFGIVDLSAIQAEIKK